MKKHTQRQLLGLLKSIVKGVTYIKENAQTNQTETVYNDCNAGVTIVRKTVGSELSEQSYMSYAELFEKVMNGLEESARIQDEAARKQLLDEVISALHDLDGTLQSEMEIKKEIVFFPYKASMWDSLESIWRAAKEDPRCDCYVVPIPYYSNGKMEFEGHLFPKDVPVVHYSLYKMEVQQPDVVYIHNPYDGNNRVTSVDQKYFSSELKKHTSKLVYVPYFVMNGSIPEHFCNQASFKNIDLIVVQSEEIRKTYLKFVPEEKVVALGSPKFDKVLHNQEKGVEIASSWSEKFAGRKVVLYNTSLGAMLADTKSYLEKMVCVFESFKSNRGLVLLWRPHPLMKSTIQSMRPMYVDTYNQIEQFFIQNELGILDLTPDFHVAIATADAYYGDVSSLIPLFAAAGKPIVLQDISLLKQEGKKNFGLKFEAIAVKDEQTMYGFSSEFNALFQIDLLTGNATFLGSAPHQPFLAKNLYVTMEIVGDKIVLVPYLDKYSNRAPQFAVYSIRDATFVIKELHSQNQFKNHSTVKDTSCVLFSATYQFEKSVFFIPYNYGAIVEYVVETGVCIYHQAPLEHLDKKSKQACYFKPFGCQIDGELYLPSADSNQVLKFSMESGAFKWLRVGTKESRYSSCYSDGKLLWCVSFTDGSLTQYSLKKFQVENQVKLPKGVQKYLSQGDFFGAIICTESEILLTPRWSNEAVRYHVTSKELKVDKTLPNSSFKSGVQYTKAVLFGNEAYLYNNKRGEVVKHNLETQSVDSIGVNLSIDEADKILSLSIHQLRSIQEDSEYVTVDLMDIAFSESPRGSNSVAKYIEMLVDHQGYIETQLQCFRDVTENFDGTCGEKIHQYLMSKI